MTTPPHLPPDRTLRRMRVIGIALLVLAAVLANLGIWWADPRWLGSAAVAVLASMTVGGMRAAYDNRRYREWEMREDRP